MKRFSTLAMIVAISTLVCLTTVGISTAGAAEDYWVWENPTPTGNGLSDVSCLDADHAWSVGAGGTILFYDGVRWNPQISPTTNNAPTPTINWTTSGGIRPGRANQAPMRAIIRMANTSSTRSPAMEAIP